MNFVSLEDIKSLVLRNILSTESLERILAQLLRIKELLDQNCMTEIELHIFMVSASVKIKEQV